VLGKGRIAETLSNIAPAAHVLIRVLPANKEKGDKGRKKKSGDYQLFGRDGSGLSEQAKKERSEGAKKEREGSRKKKRNHDTTLSVRDQSKSKGGKNAFFGERKGKDKVPEIREDRRVLPGVRCEKGLKEEIPKQERKVGVGPLLLGEKFGRWGTAKEEKMGCPPLRKKKKRKKITEEVTLK